MITCTIKTKRAILAAYLRCAADMGGIAYELAENPWHQIIQDAQAFSLETRGGLYSFVLQHELAPEYLSKRVNPRSIPAIYGRFANPSRAAEVFGRYLVNPFNGKCNWHGIASVDELEGVMGSIARMRVTYKGDVL
jgi:hypothetical protein